MLWSIRLVKLDGDENFFKFFFWGGGLLAIVEDFKSLKYTNYICRNYVGGLTILFYYTMSGYIIGIYDKETEDGPKYNF